MMACGQEDSRSSEVIYRIVEGHVRSATGLRVVQVTTQR